MNLYDFGNMSDTITFYADDDDVAWVATMLVGNGHCFCTPLKPKGKQLDNTCFLFSSVPKELIAKLEGLLESRKMDIGKSMMSFACCGENEREIYDEYTSNGNSVGKVEKWDDTHRTSTTDYCSYARKLGGRLFLSVADKIGIDSEVK